ncbi:MAG: type III-A CRISPR-associated protein Cas10/Csm1 [Candidatus Caldarchaeum sp.]
MLDTDEVILSLASLLHDIGKVLQRAGNHVKHERLSANFVKEHIPDYTTAENVSRLVEGHHEGGDDPLLRLLIEADHASAGEREMERSEETGQIYYPLHRPLKSPLADPDEKVYYPARRLSIGDLTLFYPSSQAEAGIVEYIEIANELEEGMQSIERLYNMGNTLPYIASLSELLRKELFLVPSAPAVEKEPTNSLYEHSRLTAALSICFKRSQKKSFTIIVGDIGGIQRFVYGQRVYKQALKSLKGRSAYISFLSDAVAKHLLIKLRLPPFNLIYSGGGHFMIISPTLYSSAKTELVKEINRFLLKRHKGSLRLYIGFADVNLGEPSTGTGQKKTWELLKQKINEAHEDLKKRKENAFKELLSEFYDTLFGERIEKENMVCESCGIYIEDEGKAKMIGEGEEGLRVCSICYGLADLGRRITKSKYLVEIWTQDAEIENLDDWQDVINFTTDGLSISYYLAEKKEELATFLRFLEDKQKSLRLVSVKIINDTNLTEIINHISNQIGKLPISVGFMFMPQWAPLTGDGQIMSFDDLASSSEGSAEIGYLRLDLDGMGSLIRDRADRFSVLSTVSQLVSIVMEGVVEQLVRKTRLDKTGTRTNNLYLIYSGGDDLLIIGPWNEVVEFSEVLETEIRKCFGTKRPTMSCALLVEDPKTPVKVATETLDGGSEKEKELHIL